MVRGIATAVMMTKTATAMSLVSVLSDAMISIFGRRSITPCATQAKRLSILG